MSYLSDIGDITRKYLDSHNTTSLVVVLNQTCKYDRTGVLEPRSLNDLYVYAQVIRHPAASDTVQNLVGKMVRVYMAVLF